MTMRLTTVVIALAVAGSAAGAQRVSDAEIAGMANMQRAGWKVANGKPLRVQYQLYDRLVSLALPKTYVATYQEEKSGQFIAEFAPDGETTDTWTRLVTVRALHGLGGAPVASDAVADKLFNPRVCTNGPIYRNFGERPFAPGITVTTIALGCASLPDGAYPAALKGAGEQDFAWLFRDATNFYAVKSSFRGAPWPVGKPPIPVADADRQLALLGPIQLCAADAPDEPCKTNLLLEKARRGLK